jgi:son of sevenless-like protein
MPINNLPTHVQTIPAPLPPMIPMPETPWYLGEDYDPSEIVFDDKGGVKAGTLRALVARLTPHGSTCMSFLSLFSKWWRMGDSWIKAGKRES